MSNPTSSPIPSSATAENQVPASDRQDPPVTEPVKGRKKCFVLSLIRHGEVRPSIFIISNQFLFKLRLQCRSNVFGHTLEENDHLTNDGRGQVERLGKDWRDVHIDALHTSTLERAYETALAIAKHNQDANLEVIQNDIYVERKTGQAVIDAIRGGYKERAATLYSGIPSGRNGVTPRGYTPPGGGESPNQVALRAKYSLLHLLFQYGKELDEPPKEFVDKIIDSPNVLPEGIPHVVVVSHNIFLAELYEVMYSWNSDHRMTTCNYRNVDW